MASHRTNRLRQVRIGLIGGALLVLTMVPVDALTHVPSVCLFKSLLGSDCAGCGMTRAISAALHGDAALALSYNRLVVLVLPLLLGVFFVDILRFLRKR